MRTSRPGLTRLAAWLVCLSLASLATAQEPAWIALFDESGSEAEFQQRDGKRRGEIVEIGTHFGELDRFDRFVEKLLHGRMQLLVEQFGFGHWKTQSGKTAILAEITRCRGWIAP